MDVDTIIGDFGSASAGRKSHLLAYLANAYRLLPITNSSKQQGLKH
jgi:hypothetical protein